MITRRALIGGSALAVSFPSGAALAQFATADPSVLGVTSPLGDVGIGPAEARVTIIEYASMTCSHCAHFHQTTWPALKERYVNTGQVRFVLREFPLDPLSFGVFVLMRAAPVERFFDLAETLFRRKEEWAHSNDPVSVLRPIFQEAGLSSEGFNAALRDQRLIDGVNQVREHAASLLGVNSTPTFFINGRRERGALTIGQMEAIIRPMLARG